MTAPAPVVFTVRCHYCSKQRHPREILNLGPGGAKMCLHCYEWHQKALRALCAGTPPPGCQECGVTFEQLTPEGADGNISMYVHAKDGMYQILCRACSNEYERKRLDLYGDTAYGWARKLKGAK